MAEYSLSSIGFDEAEEDRLQAVLTLSERALSDHWRYFHGNKDAQAVLVCLYSAEGLGFWQSPSRHGSSTQFVACSDAPPADARWQLAVSAGSLPSRKHLVELLNTLSRHIAHGLSDDAPAKESPSKPSAVDAAVSPPLEIPAESSEADAYADLAGPQSLDNPSESVMAADAHVDLTAPLDGLTEPDDAANVGISQPFDPSSHFLGLLQTAIAAGEDVVFAASGKIWAGVSPQAQSYYADAPVEDLLPLLRAKPEDIRSRHVDLAKAPDSPTGRQVKSHPLAELLWHASLAVSQGRLLAGCHADDVVRLRHWPQVPHANYANYLRVVAFMNHNAASLQSIAEHTGVPIAEVFDFHNACEAIGLIERHVEVELPKANKKGSSNVVKDLYRKLSLRLARVGHDK